MRILMASDLFYPYLLGGGETLMYETAWRLAKKHKIHVLTRKFKGFSEKENLIGTKSPRKLKMSLKL